MKREEEFCYWIFDLKYDIVYKKRNPTSKWEKMKHQCISLAYVVQIAAVFVHVFAIGKDSSHINSERYIQVALLIVVVLFGFLNVMNFIKLFTLLRKSSSILSFHEKEDEQGGERHGQESRHEKFDSKNDRFTHENQEFESQQQNNQHNQNNNSGSNNNNMNFFKNNESVVIQYNNNNPEGNFNNINIRQTDGIRSNHHKRASIARRSMLNPSIINSPSLQRGLSLHQNAQQNKETHTSLNLIKFIGLFNIVLFMSCAHLLSVVAIIVKIPPYSTHRILYSLQIFEAVPINCFTSIVGFNIIFNLIVDTPFLKNILQFKNLPFYIKSLMKSSGYFFLYLILIGGYWGSIVCLSTENKLDIPSILLIVLFSVYCLYYVLIYIYKKYT